jgi:hypothetical protein
MQVVCASAKKFLLRLENHLSSPRLFVALMIESVLQTSGAPFRQVSSRLEQLCLVASWVAVNELLMAAEYLLQDRQKPTGINMFNIAQTEELV